MKDDHHLDERRTAESFRSSEGSKVHDHLGIVPERQYPPVRDDDLTMVEISDMRIATELMCNRQLRPPMPVGIPLGLSHRRNIISFFLLFLLPIRSQQSLTTVLE